MRDERYYQRLNEIRQKYGYLNGFGPNPEEDTKHSPTTRPTQVSHNVATSNHYQTPLRSAQNQLNYAQLDQRRGKDNKSTPPVNYGNLASGNITAQRIFREKMNEIERPKLNIYQKENSSPYKAGMVPTPSNKRHNQTPNPNQRPNYSEYSSPIKRLGDLSNRDTPRDLSKYGEKSTCLKPNKNYRTAYGNRTERPTEDPTRISDQILKQATEASLKNRSYLDKPSKLPQREANPPLQGEQYNSKYNTNLNSIDRIQEKIQAVLNKIKR